MARSGQDAAPLLGVVIAAYEAQQYLPFTLQSLVAQTHCAWHCVVVDDGSLDDTREIAANTGDPRVHVVHRENGGISAARNTGLQQLPDSVEFISFLDADDVLEPHALERLVTALLRAPQCDAVYGLAELVDSSGASLSPGLWPAFQRERWHLQRGQFLPLPVSQPSGFDSLLHDWLGYPMCVLLVRRSAVDLNGPFDTALATCKDWDYALRLARRTPLLLLDEVVARYRRHERNHTLNEERTRASDRAVRAKAAHDPANSPAHTLIARQAWRALQREAGLRALVQARAAVTQRSPTHVARYLAAVAVHVARWLRGTPIKLRGGRRGRIAARGSGATPGGR